MGKTADPIVIQMQMQFASFEMMKMFMAALATSAAAIAALAVVGLWRDDVMRIWYAGSAWDGGMYCASLPAGA